MASDLMLAYRKIVGMAAVIAQVKTLLKLFLFSLVDDARVLAYL
ncbi:hypothetical protein GL4_1869 [Methyloceanibacter caenitepidi]|uniref:Uncharacterized protein n=1 Tax=Methyloceanibacter caenitepidi TaxID=1384459 RepID=A0A0A8K3F2_9HYPH|nr:hypothetical protein GL4_1869 [Methyloceanibacter caenitepidi]